MIKKKTKLIFENEKGRKVHNLIGGMPLTKGEIVSFQLEGQNNIIDYEVVAKTTNLLKEGEDWIVNTAYALKRKQNS